MPENQDPVETAAAPAVVRRAVAIVGRPNVGKSAIFNRLVGRRLAIVHEQWGVTRDRLAAEGAWGDRRFEVIDTGGIGVMDGAGDADQIAAGTRQQVELAIGEAAVALMVVDIQAGLVPLDEEVARLLRHKGLPVFLVANKADNDAREAGAEEFQRLGYPVFPVSALHNRGFGDLMEAVLPLLPEVVNPTIANPLKVAVVGRPNAGKSSYVNALLKQERVIVSDVPGTTRDSIEIPFAIGSGPQARHYLLIDTAGMRHDGKVREAVEHYSILRGRKTIERADVVVLVVDAKQGPTIQDKKIADLVREDGRGCVVFVNKWDLIPRDVTKQEYAEALRRELPFLNHAPILFGSAKTRRGVAESIEAVDLVAANVTSSLSTGLLNRVLRAAFEKVQPPMVKGRRLKLFYATQVGYAPIRIRLFVNDLTRRNTTYDQFLINRLRENFSLDGAPVRLQYAERTDKKGGGGRPRGGPADAPGGEPGDEMGAMD